MSARDIRPETMAPILAAALALGGAPASVVALAPAFAALFCELLCRAEEGENLAEIVAARLPDDTAVVVRVLEQLRANEERKHHEP